MRPWLVPEQATAGLGAIDGGTIFLGLPVGRARGLSVQAKLALSMLAGGA